MSAAGEVVTVPTLPAPEPPRPPRPRRVRADTVAGDATRWRDLLKLVAWHVHDLRQLLHLSQQHLALRAGVSQGAISRLEGGRCGETPLLTYARVVAAFARELGPLQEQLTPDVRQVLAWLERVLRLEDAPRAPLPLFEDPTVQNLIRVYRRMEPADRADYAEMAETLGRWMLERVESKA